MDSSECASRGAEVCGTLTRWLLETLGSDRRDTLLGDSVHVAQQEDDTSCGLFTLVNMLDLLSGHEDEHATQHLNRADLTNLREWGARLVFRRR
jgi:hypothetical protein